MKTHDLKCWPIFFEDILSGKKKFEVRFNDRNFQPGHLVVLREFIPDKMVYTGRKYWAQIGYVLKGMRGITDGYCIFDLSHGSRIQRRKYSKIYRLNHVENRNVARKANYDKTKPKKRINSPWTKTEINTLLDPMWSKGMMGDFSDWPVTDAQISKCLKRSVQAIQQKRYLLKKAKI